MHEALRHCVKSASGALLKSSATRLQTPLPNGDTRAHDAPKWSGGSAPIVIFIVNIVRYGFARCHWCSWRKAVCFVHLAKYFVDWDKQSGNTGCICRRRQFWGGIGLGILQLLIMFLRCLMVQHLFLQGFVFGIFSVDKHAAFAKLALAMTHFVLTQGCLVPWVNERRRVCRSAQLMFPMSEMAFCAVKTFPRRHKMDAKFGFEFFGVR